MVNLYSQDEQFTEIPNNDEDLKDLPHINSTTVSQAVVNATDWTTETILNQINKGNIILNPNFQRRDAWQPSRKSKFIESLILGLPIPQIVLAESKERKGSYIVIDGKQRLLSIRQFAAEKGDESYSQLKLTDLDIRRDLEGKSLSDLKGDPYLFEDLSSFENQTIRTVVIRNWKDENFLYTVFLRLNTGSLPLSPQELRQALHPGPFIDFIDLKSVESKALREILKTSKPDFRMRDVELLVRYYAYQNFLPEYSGNLKLFLDTTCEKLNKSWVTKELDIRAQGDNFEAAYEATCSIFGVRNAFKKWIGDSYERRFNRAIFDIMMFYFADPHIRRKAIDSKNDVEHLFKNLCSNRQDFLDSIEQTTKSLESNSRRISIWGDGLRDALEMDFHVPRLIDGRIR